MQVTHPCPWGATPRERAGYVLVLRNIILEMIATGAALQATIDRLCVEIEKEAGGGIVCSVLAIDADGIVHPLSSPSLPLDYSRGLDGMMIGPGMGSCGSAAYLREPVVVTDIATDPRWTAFRDGALAAGLRACWSTPLFDEHGRVIGTFACYYREARGPTEAERVLIDACIHLCSIALQRHERVLERERRANIDVLTQIANRAAFELALSRLACDEPGGWALLVVDLDNLKVINDSFGHHAGDLLIRAAADRIARLAKPNRAFRVGGDEFAILVQSPEALARFDDFAHALIASLGEPIECNGHAIVPRATLGGAIVSGLERGADEVRQNADYALYHAKETGRGGFVRYWTGLDSRIANRIAAIRDVRAALREGRIEAHYQPIVHLGTRHPVALEALCRLRMANGGLLSAGSFREAMADPGIAAELTERMLALVAADMGEWQARDLPLRHVGINIALANLHEGRIERQVAAAVDRHGLPLDRIVIEIAEQDYSALRDVRVLQAIEVLRARGLRVALDDFGAGGGLLMPVLTMPVDIIKIDRMLVERLSPDDAGAAAVCGLLLTAGMLGIDIIAEGVETEQQALRLTELGCTFAQGYFFARPLDRDMTTRFLEASRPRRSLRVIRSS